MGKYPETQKLPTYEESVKAEPNIPNDVNVERHDTMSSYAPASYVLVSTTTVPPANTNVILASVPRSEPILVNCPYCFKLVTTVVKPISGCLTWLSCAAIAFLGGVWGCCLIPFCIPRLMDVQHICPACDKVVAKFERL